MAQPVSFSEHPAVSVDLVLALQDAFEPLDSFLSFVSAATNPASILHYLVPLLTLWDPPLAIQALASYVIGDTTNLMLKWPARGDRPYWMDPRVRQFGGNTCEVGWGMPSGHMQVTVGVYVVMAMHFRKLWLTAFISVLIAVTALSRMHMGAHTPMQVVAGAAVGAATAYVVMQMSSFLKWWSSRNASESRRLGYACAAALVISLIIVVEHWALETAGMHPSESVQRATAACRGGLHQTVGTGKGIARDTGALLGGAMGRALYYRYSSQHKAEKPMQGDVKAFWQLFAMWALASELCMKLFTQVENSAMGASEGLIAKDVAEALFSGLKYCTFGALSTGVFALVLGTSRNALIAERKNEVTNA